MSEKKRPPQGPKTPSDYDAEGRAVRANMEKLRALRLAREAAAPVPAAPVKKAAAKKAKTSPAKLSDWLADQRKGGHRT